MKKIGKQRKESTIRFWIDGIELSFPPLSLGSILIIADLVNNVKFNQRLLSANYAAAFLIATATQPQLVRRIVALYTIGERPTLELVVKREDFLKGHCSVEDLATLFAAGILANPIGKLQELNMSSLTDEEIYETPLYEIIKKRELCQE